MPSKASFSFELFRVSQTVVTGAQPSPYCMCIVSPMHRGQWREATAGLPGKCVPRGTESLHSRGGGKAVEGVCQAHFSWYTCSYCPLEVVFLSSKGQVLCFQRGLRLSLCDSSKSFSKSAAFLLSFLALSLGSVWIPTHSARIKVFVYLTSSLRLSPG